MENLKNLRHCFWIESDFSGFKRFERLYAFSHGPFCRFVVCSRRSHTGTTMFRGGRHVAEQNRSPFPQGRRAPSVFLRLSALGAQRPTIATGVLSYSV